LLQRNCFCNLCNLLALYIATLLCTHCTVCTEHFETTDHLHLSPNAHAFCESHFCVPETQDSTLVVSDIKMEEAVQSNLSIRRTDIPDSALATDGSTAGTVVWLCSVLSQVSAWLLQRNSEPAGEGSGQTVQELLQDWEWVMSRAEQAALQTAEQDSFRIKEELSNLRKNGNSLKYRSFFYESVAKPAIETLNPAQLADVATTLDPSKTSKILADVVHDMEDKWLALIQAAFFPDTRSDAWKHFKDSYKEKPYEKNIVGSVKELAFSASHGPKNVGIDARVLADILWSIWKTLSAAIRTELGRDLEHLELLLIANEVSHAKDKIISLWIETARNSRVGAKREGVVVQKWKNEQQQLQLLKIKEAAVADAKFKQPAQAQVPFKDFKQVQKVLEEKLTFSTSS